jgi:parvulin-like peptidyl-prolyl isomerase
MIWSLIALLSAAAAAPANAGAPAPKPLARVGAESIGADQVLARAGASRITPQAALDELIAEALLAAEGRKAGLKAPASARPAIDGARRSAALALYLERVVFSKVTVPEAQLRERFHQRGDQVRLLLLVRASQEEARGALDRLGKGASFAEEAKASIDEPSRAKGGALGWTARSALAAELAATAFTAPLKTPQGPVALRGGFAVFVVEDRRLPDDKAFELTRAGLQRDLEPAARASALEAHRQQVVLQAKGKVDEQALLAGGDGLAVDPKRAGAVVASAGDVKVTLGELGQALRSGLEGGAMGHGRAPPEVKVTLARTLLAQALMEKAAVARFAKAREVEEAGRAVERAEVARLQGDRIRQAVPAGSNAEIEGRYQAHLAEFTTPAGRRCWELVAKTEDGVKALAARVARGEELAAVARDSADPATAAKGGLAGVVSDASLQRLGQPDGEPDLVAALKELPPGQLSRPVKLKKGFIVLRCDARTPEQVTPLEQVRHRVSMELRAERGEAAVKARAEQLRAGATVQIDQAALAALTPPPTPRH